MAPELCFLVSGTIILQCLHLRCMLAHHNVKKDCLVCKGARQRNKVRSPDIYPRELTRGMNILPLPPPPPTL